MTKRKQNIRKCATLDLIFTGSCETLKLGNVHTTISSSVTSHKNSSVCSTFPLKTITLSQWGLLGAVGICCMMWTEPEWYDWVHWWAFETSSRPILQGIIAFFRISTDGFFRSILLSIIFYCCTSCRAQTYIHCDVFPCATPKYLNYNSIY